MTALHEQYRPRTWSEVVGQDRALARIDALRRRGLAGRAYWLSGKSGTGKTTIARLLAAEVADECCTYELDAGTVTPSELERLERGYQCFGMGQRNGWAVIVNEAHGLRAAAIRQLLVMLERLPGHVVWVFTTTSEGQRSLFEDHIDAHPLLSRCAVLELASAPEPLSQLRGSPQWQAAAASPVTAAFAARARSIAQEAGLDGQPLEDYAALVLRHRGNLRAVLGEIESGAMIGGGV